MNEQVGLWIGFIFTLMIFSYILGDNILYRLAVYVFVGLAAGYITLVTVESVILPWLNGTVMSADAGLGGLLVGLVPFILGLLLLLKTSPRLGRAGNIAIAFIIGVGTAVSLVGAIAGTLLPLSMATGSGVRIDVLNGFLISLGVICTLMYFYYLSQRKPNGEVQRRLLVRAVAGVGQLFIVVTLGAIYAGAILTSLTIFSERIGFILARITGG
jgi:hypothetical protein